MSRRYAEIVDIRPVATNGWTVAVASVDDESGEILRQEFALAGWAICRTVAHEGDGFEEHTDVRPCWYDTDELSIGLSADVVTVCEPNTAPDWAAVKTSALHAMRRRYDRKKARDGR